MPIDWSGIEGKPTRRRPSRRPEFEVKRFAEQRGFLEKALTGLEYPGNVVRSGLRGAILKNEDVITNAIQALQLKRRTTPEQLKDIITTKTIGKKIRFGIDDDTKIQKGDIADFAVDVGIDILTDPLSWVTFGLSNYAKVAGTAKQLRKIPGGEELLTLKDEALDAINKAKDKTEVDAIFSVLKDEGYKLSDNAKDLALNFNALEKMSGVGALSKIKKYEAMRKGAQLGFGAMYGVSTADPNAPLTEKIFRAGAGMALVGAARNKARALHNYTLGRYNAKGVWQSGVLDGLIDRYKTITKGIGRRLPLQEAKITAMKEAKKLAPNDEVLQKSLAETFTNSLTSPMKYSEAWDLAVRVAWPKLRDKEQLIMQGRLSAIKNLSPAEQAPFEAILRDLKIDFAEKRLELLKKKGVKNPSQLNMRIASDKALFDDATREANDWVTNIKFPKRTADQDEKVIKALNDQADFNLNLIDSLNSATERKLMPVKWHIDDVFEAKDYLDADAMTWITFPKRSKIHMLKRGTADEEAFKQTARHQAELGLVLDNIKAGKLSTKEGLDILKNRAKGDLLGVSDAIKAEAAMKSHSIYAKQFAKKFMTKKENQAIATLARDISVLPKQKSAVVWEKGLKGFDRMNNFMKANMLQFTVTWMRNNYFDNLVKSYVETGLPGAIKTSMFGMNKNLINDMKTLSEGSLKTFKDPELLDALSRGVLEAPMFQIIKEQDRRLVKYVMPGKRLEEALATKGEISSFMKDIGLPDAYAEHGITKLSDKGHRAISKLMDTWQNMLSASTGKIGTLMESTARMTTYKNLVNSFSKTELKELFEKKAIERLKASTVYQTADEITKKGLVNQARAASLAEIKNVAADITKRTFFDYGTLTAVEAKFAKRMMPFYSFYSKNLPYWVKGLFDIERIGRIADFDRLRRHLGREPTDEDRKGLSTYILNNAPRLIGHTPFGKKYITFPASSVYDAIQMLNPQTALKQIEEKLNPYLKVPAELLTNRDWFTGGFLTPSEIRNDIEKSAGIEGKKYLFSRGFKYKKMQDWLEKIGFKKGVLGVEVDAKGNPIARRDGLVIADRIMSVLWPMGIIDKAAGEYSKVKFGKQNIRDAIINTTLPVSTPIVSPQAEQWLSRQRATTRRPLE